MRSIVGVQKIAGGSIEVLGLETGARELRGRIGYVTQQVSVDFQLFVGNVDIDAVGFQCGRTDGWLIAGSFSKCIFNFAVRCK